MTKWEPITVPTFGGDMDGFRATLPVQLPDRTVGIPVRYWSAPCGLVLQCNGTMYGTLPERENHESARDALQAFAQLEAIR